MAELPSHEMKEISRMLQSSQDVIQVFPADVVAEHWLLEFARGENIFKQDIVTMQALINDGITIERIIHELGINGKAVVKNISGKDYILLRGKDYSSVKRIFTGVKYRVTEPLIVDMAIGKVGMATSVVKGTGIAFIIYASLNVLEYMIKDSYTVEECLGQLVSDFVKTSIPAAASIIAGMMIGSVAGATMGPIIVAVITGLWLSNELNSLDKHYRLTKELQKQIGKIVRPVRTTIEQFLYALEWRIINNDFYY